MATPAQAREARKRIRAGKTFDADKRTQERESSPVVINTVTFSRRRKDWSVTRIMRAVTRDQAKSVARRDRLLKRAGELEAEQIEAATVGETAREEELEGRIEELLREAEATTEDAELCTYRLLALLLVPGLAPTAEDVRDPLEDARAGFGPDAVDDEDAVMAAIAWLQPALDVEDAADLAAELTGSVEPEPAEDPSSATG